MHKIGLKNKLQKYILKKKKMAVGIIAASKVAKRVSKKGRAEAKEKKAGKLDKKAERKNKRADRIAKRAAKKMSKGKMGKAAKLMGKSKKVAGKADVKTGKAIQKREKAGKLKDKIAAGKTVKGRIKKAVKGAANLKSKAKNVAAKAKQGAGQAARKVKSKAQETAMNAKAGVKKVKRKAAAATAAFKSTAMYDGPGGQETPKLGSMSDGNSMYNKAPGMYGKGSKISYGHHSGMKMSGYAKAGLAGKGMAMMNKTSANTVLKHGATKKGSGMYHGKKK